MAKNGHVHEGGKVGRSAATPSNFFSTNSYDLKSLSFKFGNDTLFTFEMPRVSYRRLVDKMNISLLFRPSVIRGPWTALLESLIGQPYWTALLDSLIGRSYWTALLDNRIGKTYFIEGT